MTYQDGITRYLVDMDSGICTNNCIHSIPLFVGQLPLPSFSLICYQNTISHRQVGTLDPSVILPGLVLLLSGRMFRAISIPLLSQESRDLAYES